MNVNVTEKRWAYGWELQIMGMDVTQSTSLAAAEKMVRGCVALHEDIADGSTIEISLVVKINPATDREFIDAERAVQNAAPPQQQAAAHQRATAANSPSAASRAAISRSHSESANNAHNKSCTAKKASAASADGMRSPAQDRFENLLELPIEVWLDTTDIRQVRFRSAHQTDIITLSGFGTNIEDLDWTRLPTFGSPKEEQAATKKRQTHTQPDE